ncbi:MAG: amidohydrolase family protein [Acidobacteria bacterium]|nr:amidohydrolase family protein [Acidobacteriota bacterium]
MKKLSFTILISLAICAAVVTLAQPRAVTTPGNTIAITNARIVTVSGATHEKGTIVIRDGKIIAVGPTAPVPTGAKIIPGAGLTVYPGMIDTYTTLGLTEVDAVNATVDTTELGDYNANMKALTAVQPNSELIPVARSNGVTTVLTCPQGGVISGQCAFINLDGWTQEQMKLVAPGALHLVYPRVGFGGRGGGFGGGGNLNSPSEAAKQARDRKVEDLKKKLEAAQEYLKAKAAAANDKTIPVRPVDLGLEALAPFLNGQAPVLIAASGKAEIEGALALADQFKLKLVLYGAESALQVADKIKAKNVPIVLPAVLDLPDKEDSPYDEAFARAAEFHKAGLKVCFSSSDSASDVRLLPYHAGTAAAFGLPKEEALKGVTLYPAQIFGLDKLVGSLETGKIANVVVTDGDLLEHRTRIKYLIINGKLVELANKHTRLYERHKDRQ